VARAPRSRPPELPEDDDRELKYAPTRTQYKAVYKLLEHKSTLSRLSCTRVSNANWLILMIIIGRKGIVKSKKGSQIPILWDALADQVTIVAATGSRSLRSPRIHRLEG
jgi:hypothetical protein